MNKENVIKNGEFVNIYDHPNYGSIQNPIGWQIKAQRKLRGKTQEELAGLIGKERRYIIGVESNKTIPRPFDLANIEKELKFKVQL